MSTNSTCIKHLTILKLNGAQETMNTSYFLCQICLQIDCNSPAKQRYVITINVLLFYPFDFVYFELPVPNQKQNI